VCEGAEKKAVERFRGLALAEDDRRALAAKKAGGRQDGEPRVRIGPARPLVEPAEEDEPVVGTMVVGRRAPFRGRPLVEAIGDDGASEGLAVSGARADVLATQVYERSAARHEVVPRRQPEHAPVTAQLDDPREVRRCDVEARCESVALNRRVLEESVDAIGGNQDDEIETGAVTGVDDCDGVRSATNVLGPLGRPLG
jgi:hypothetical protein